MRDTFDQRRTQSALDFANIVWPAISHWFDGELIHLEGYDDNAVAKILDRFTGTDAFYISEQHAIRGIASRVQWGQRSDSFTIRYYKPRAPEQEYHHRKRAIEAGDGEIYPYYTTHAYLTHKGGDLISAACIKTAELIRICDLILEKCGPFDPDWASAHCTTRPHFGMYGIQRTWDDTLFIFADWVWIASVTNANLRTLVPDPPVEQQPLDAAWIMRDGPWLRANQQYNGDELDDVQL